MEEYTIEVYLMNMNITRHVCCANLLLSFLLFKRFYVVKNHFRHVLVDRNTFSIVMHHSNVSEFGAFGRGGRAATGAALKK